MPDDTSPHGGEALHPLPDRAKIPEARPGAVRDPSGPAGQVAPDPAERPAPPGHPSTRPADVSPSPEDAGAEPARGTASGTGKPSVTRQPG